MRSQPRRPGELTLTAIKLTFASAGSPTMYVGELSDSGGSQYLSAMRPGDRPVYAGTGGTSRP